MRLAFMFSRFALEEVWRLSQKKGTALGDLTIITGVGKGSLHAFEPVVSFSHSFAFKKPPSRLNCEAVFPAPIHHCSMGSSVMFA